MPQQELVGIQQGVLEIVKAGVAVADLRKMRVNQIALAGCWGGG